MLPLFATTRVTGSFRGGFWLVPGFVAAEALGIHIWLGALPQAARMVPRGKSAGLDSCQGRPMTGVKVRGRGPRKEAVIPAATAWYAVCFAAKEPLEVESE